MNPASTPPAHSAIKVLAALAELGEATAADVAEHAGLGYSTTTPKLRAWEDSGQAERFRTGDGRTLWRLTAAGRAATATREPDGHTPQDAGTAEPTVAPEMSDERCHNGTSGPATGADDSRSASERAEPTTAGAEPAKAPAEEPVTPPGTVSVGDTPADPTPGQERDSSDTGDGASAAVRPAKTRRAGGSLRDAVLDILEAHPDRQYKTGELCKLIDAANEGTGASKASAGAVVNAATKLVAAGAAVQTVERPATFQLAPTVDGR
jgi:DNA-binding MarR family transcriptional regulator